MFTKPEINFLDSGGDLEEEKLFPLLEELENWGYSDEHSFLSVNNEINVMQGDRTCSATW